MDECITRKNRLKFQQFYHSVMFLYIALIITRNECRLEKVLLFKIEVFSKLSKQETKLRYDLTKRLIELQIISKFCSTLCIEAFMYQKLKSSVIPIPNQQVRQY